MVEVDLTLFMRGAVLSQEQISTGNLPSDDEISDRYVLAMNISRGELIRELQDGITYDGNEIPEYVTLIAPEDYTPRNRHRVVVPV